MPRKKPAPPKPATAATLAEMTGAEFEELRRAVGFDRQEDVVKWFGYSMRSCRRWASDGPPDAVAIVLRLMRFNEMTPREVETILKHG